MVPELKLTLILDYHRSSRGLEESSITLIEPLLEQFEKERINVLCYKNTFSTYFEKIFKLNHKIGEVLGVHHMKYLVFDDDVLLTG